MTITGTNFNGTNIIVKFGGTNATNVDVISSTQITAIVDDGTTGLVSVTTSGGTATKSGFTFTTTTSTTATTTTAITPTTSTTSASEPTITSFSPTSASEGDSVVITGTNFVGTGIVVRFGGTNAASVTVNSSTQITAVVGDGTSGIITITTDDGTVSDNGFTYIPATTTTPVENNNPSPLDFNLANDESAGVLTQSYSQDQSENGTGLMVRLSIKQGTKLTDSAGDAITDITVNFASIPKSESTNIIPIQAYEFGPDGSTFNPAISITVPYDPTKLPGANSASHLKVAYYSTSNDKWEYINCKVDTTNHLIQWQTTHFTTFAIVYASGFQLSWSLLLYVLGILILLGLVALAVTKREKLVVAFAGWRGNHGAAVVEERGSKSSVIHDPETSVYSPAIIPAEKTAKTSLYRPGEEVYRSIEIDKGNVKCNEIGVVLEENNGSSNGNGPIRIRLGYNPQLGAEDVIKIDLIKRTKDDESVGHDSK